MAVIDSSIRVTIGALAELAGVGVETIRFYQRKGLLVTPDRPNGGIRRYGSVELRRVRFIKSAQRLGFSLNDIAALLRLEDGSQCDEVRGHAERRLADVRSRLADLQRIETSLSQLVADCRASTGKANCPLIASLTSSGAQTAVPP